MQIYKMFEGKMHKGWSSQWGGDNKWSAGKGWKGDSKRQANVSWPQGWRKALRGSAGSVTTRIADGTSGAHNADVQRHAPELEEPEIHASSAPEFEGPQVNTHQQLAYVERKYLKMERSINRQHKVKDRQQQKKSAC